MYIIRGPKGRVLHVGRTVSGKRGLFQRLRNHLQSRSSFMLLYGRPRKLQLRGHCYFQYVLVPHPRQRALLEALAIGTLLPAHIGDSSRKSVVAL